MAVTRVDAHKTVIFIGLSTDDKPTMAAKNGDWFDELDTGKRYRFSESNKTWYEQSGGAADSPFEIVTVSRGYDDDDQLIVTLDKTHAEMYEIYASGKTLVAIDSANGVIGSVGFDAEDTPIWIDMVYSTAYSEYSYSFSIMSVLVGTDDTIEVTSFNNDHPVTQWVVELTKNADTLICDTGIDDLLPVISNGLDVTVHLETITHTYSEWYRLTYCSDAIVRFVSDVHYLECTVDGWTYGSLFDL